MDEKKKKLLDIYAKASTPQELFADSIELSRKNQTDIKKVESKLADYVRLENLQKIIPTLKDGETPTDEQIITLIKPLIPKSIPGKDGSLITPEEVRDKLKELKGKERLSVFDLKDLEWVKNKNGDQIQWASPGALSKVSHDATLTGDGTPSNPLSVPGGDSPLTTKGDIYGFSTTGARIPVGTDGQVLTANSGTALGVDWETPSGGSTVYPSQFYLGYTPAITVSGNFNPIAGSLTNVIFLPEGVYDSHTYYANYEIYPIPAFMFFDTGTSAWYIGVGASAGVNAPGLSNTYFNWKLSSGGPAGTYAPTPNAAFSLTATTSTIYPLTPTPPPTPTVVTTAITSGTTQVAEYLTDFLIPNSLYLPTGTYSITAYLKASGGTTTGAFDIWEVDNTGADITKIGTTTSTPTLTSTSTPYVLTYTSTSPYFFTNTDSRLELKLQATTGSSINFSITNGGTSSSFFSPPSNEADIANSVPYTGARLNVNLGTQTIYGLDWQVSSYISFFDGSLLRTDGNGNMTGVSFSAPVMYQNGNNVLDSSSGVLTPGSNISELNNDVGYINNISGQSLASANNDAGFLNTISGQNISQLNNDSGFISSLSEALSNASITPAADGTYSVPTSIQIVSGIIVAIS